MIKNNIHLVGLLTLAAVPAMYKLVLWACLLAAAAAQDDVFELNIIHFNDFHAQ